MDKTIRHSLLVALLIGGLLAGLFLLALFARHPIFGASLMLMIYVVGCYISAENHNVHRAQEFENRFWTACSFVFSTCVFFVKDSPFAIGQWSISAGFLGVVMFTYGIHSFDRHLHRKYVGRVPHMPLSIATIACSSMLDGGISVQTKVALILDALKKIDSTLVPTNIQQLISGYKRKASEELIIHTLADATPEELNYMLPRITLGLILYKVKDHPQMPNRTLLLDLLCQTRVADMSVSSRAIVLDALQQMKLGAHPKSEIYARNILIKTKGDDLSTLKSLTDNKGDFHSLHKLVYVDIKDPKIRDEVLKHIAHQANVQAAHMSLKTKASRVRGDRAWRKILSDVDDTLTCSGARFLAGIDSSYPRKTVYPGVLDFYRELDLGVSGPEAWPEGRMGNLIFLSARPHVYKDVSESHTYGKFKKLQEQKKLYTSPTLMAGSVETGRAFVLYNDVEALAVKKFENFEQFRSLYPEFKCVFIGDNGQGDVRAGEMMLEKYPASIERVYVHVVQPIPKTYGWKGPETLKRWKQLGLCFCTNYVEAACDAYKKKLISALGLRRVAYTAAMELGKIPFEHAVVREEKKQNLNRSIRAASELLIAAGLEPVDELLAAAAFEIGALVLTPLGRGVVVGFRPRDAIYDVVLEWGNTKIPTPAPSSRKPLPPECTTASPMQMQRSTSSPARPPLSRAGSRPPTPSNASAPAHVSTPIRGATPRPVPSFMVSPSNTEPPHSPRRLSTSSSRPLSPEKEVHPLIPPESYVEPVTQFEEASLLETAVDVAVELASGIEEVVEEIVTVGSEAGDDMSSLGLEGSSSGAVDDGSMHHSNPSMWSSWHGQWWPSKSQQPPPITTAASLGIDPSQGSDNMRRVGSSTDLAMSASTGGGRQRSYTTSSMREEDERVKASPRNSKLLPTNEVNELLEAAATKKFQAHAYLPLSSLRIFTAEDEKRLREKEKLAAKKAAEKAALSAKKGGLFSRGREKEVRGRTPFVKGTLVKCFMGEAEVVKYRTTDNMYEVQLLSWILSTGKHATATLRPEDVKESARSASRTPSQAGKSWSITGFFSLDRGGAGARDAAAALAARSALIRKRGATVSTVFGPAVVTGVRPVVGTMQDSADGASRTSKQGGGLTIVIPKDKADAPTADVMLELELIGWRLANGKFARAVFHPAHVWLADEKPPSTPIARRSSISAKNSRSFTSGSSGGGSSLLPHTHSVFSIIGDFITGGSKKKGSKPVAPPPAPLESVPEPLSPLTEAPQLYPTGAVVTLSLHIGHALIKGYRPQDKIYCLALLDWRLADSKSCSGTGFGPCAQCFCPASAICSVVLAPGMPVISNFGLGTVSLVREADGIIVVNSQSPKLTQYLPRQSIRTVGKAAIGDHVCTEYGKGRLVRYHQGYKDVPSTYVTELEWGATLYSPEKSAQLLPVKDVHR